MDTILYIINRLLRPDPDFDALALNLIFLSNHHQSCCIFTQNNYNFYTMTFEWDEKKSRTNKSKHGIDFNTATELWNDQDRIEIQTNFQAENRNVLIGKIKDKLWTAIFTRRVDAIRIISVRRARKQEAKLYGHQ